MTSFWIVPLAAVVLAQAAVLATSMYLHRALAHRSVAVHAAAEAQNPETIRRFASDIREDRLDRAVFSSWGWVGLALGATLL
jgi:fatty-acid desaturase